ncbi:tetratricopeptide repeat protein [Pelagerythrobacter rhizovicinus]|uniref:Uncharacterized protein n=1 Tax=Pelagerythrobacter rhizovicinus TaxID=2268576 RepID=A0A4Q2KHI9_9SPHN|nr:tetratricopeptide repeat protein [Pelagerythrobacter rhizovicinus]RXZ64594.1 hypothetical protein ETX26_11960 [Pelagerythrobacter rhizovicinus]
MTVLLALLLQVGPAPAIEPISPIPEELQEQRERTRARRNAYVEVLPETSRLAQCLTRTREDPGAAANEAHEWLTAAGGPDRGDAAQCLGVAQARLGQQSQAAGTFLQARDATPPGDHRARALRGGLAGGALLAQGNPAGALELLDVARVDAQAAGEEAILGQIAIDRAIALVALERLEEAETALETARAALPDNVDAWLLSATLSRRHGKLDEAQARIERAAVLDPLDPGVGLEAGVIAAMAGRDDAARKNWRSVIEAAPGSDAAATAQAYLEQLDAP